MRFYVEKLKEKEVVLDFSEAAESFPALDALIQAGESRFSGPVTGRLRAFLANSFVEVEGRVVVRVVLACSRCLKEIEAPVDTRFTLTFSAGLPPIEGGEEDEVELSAEEMGLIPFDGDEIDLREAVQEQVIMELPVRPLCEEACKGLCAHCGANLNDGDCGCSAPVFNNKFAALKGFKAEK
ncbi:YceD family protein [Geoalkalibacter sp.]|uniref:YceD family protein n=1 Tax=Geoalkalibacter sp. TaxID=3041440 RepID=UPI00272E75DE|nr:DUF177 domain-containing protein [Geoalkalibacter sp.]